MTAAATLGTSSTPQAGSARMLAHARVATELRAGPGVPRTHVTTLRSDPPLALRQTIATRPEPGVSTTPGIARVSLTAAAAGPIGGDQYRLDVDVGAGSTLVLNEVSATLLLPSHDGAVSRSVIRIHVETAGTLIWLPGAVIAARRCDHLNEVQVELEEGARLLMREEFLLGRHHEPCGRLRQQVRIRQAGRSLYRQDLDLGGPASGTPGVAAGYRAVGSLLVVDPAWHDAPPQVQELPGQAAMMPLAGAAVLISALADDSLALHHQLELGLAALGPPWQPRP